MTTVPVPSAALTVGRQGNYAGAVSRLAAFAADVGASWGIYTLGVALLNAAVKLVTGHSFTLDQPPAGGLHRADALGVPLLHLPMGGQRKDARHGDPRAAGGDRARAAPSAGARPSSGPWASGSPCSSRWASASSASCTSTSGAPSTTSSPAPPSSTTGTPGRPACAGSPARRDPAGTTPPRQLGTGPALGRLTQPDRGLG